jgi:hypothetical protein
MWGCGYCDGGYSDHITVPHPKYLIGLDGLDPVSAAPYACSGVTTYGALRKLSDVYPAEPIVVIGAGGLGLMCLSILKALGGKGAGVHNGSSLFTGDAGQGESNIRRWIIENDWLEAIVALPLNMFYNTGIATYVWVLTNRKPEHRRGQVQLIDATQWFRPLRKNMAGIDATQGIHIGWADLARPSPSSSTCRGAASVFTRFVLHSRPEQIRFAQEVLHETAGVHGPGRRWRARLMSTASGPAAQKCPKDRTPPGRNSNPTMGAAMGRAAAPWLHRKRQSRR